MKINYIKQALSEVFSKKKYLIMSLILSLAIFILFIVLNNLPMFASALKINLALMPAVLSNAIWLIYSVKGPFLFGLIILISLLAGLNLSLLIYKFKLAVPSSDKGSAIGFAGIFGGALSSGCSACTLPLISILGISGSLAVLPLKGEEFTILAILLLLVSLHITSKSISKKTCEVRLINKKKTRK